MRQLRERKSIGQTVHFPRSTESQTEIDKLRIKEFRFESQSTRSTRDQFLRTGGKDEKKEGDGGESVRNREKPIANVPAERPGLVAIDLSRVRDNLSAA